MASKVAVVNLRSKRYFECKRLYIQYTVFVGGYVLGLSEI